MNENVTVPCSLCLQNAIKHASLKPRLRLGDDVKALVPSPLLIIVIVSRLIRIVRWNMLQARRHATIIGCLLALIPSATYGFRWIRGVPGCRYLRQTTGSASRQSSCTSLAAVPRDPRRDQRPGDSDEERQARAEAEAARRKLERMWSSTSFDDDVDPERAEKEAKLQAELDKRVVGDRRENPFPTSSERGALEASLATQKALVAGKRGLIIDVEVMQMDDQHPEFNPELLVHFVGEISKALATMIGRVKVMYKGETLAATATLAFKKSSDEDAERGIEPRDDISFCSFLAPTFSREELAEGVVDANREVRKFARRAAAQFSEDDNLLVVVGPRTPTDVAVLRKVLRAAEGRSVVVINPKMSYNPRQMTRYETVYQLRQFKVIPIKTNPRDMAARSPLAISLDQRRQTFVTCELGQVVPKVLIVRSFPEDFKLYVDLDGTGFKLMKTFDRLPMLPIVCLTAQTIVGKYQREVTRTQLAEERRQREMEWAKEDQDAYDDDNK